MKDIFRNQIFYFIAVPLVIALWPLLLSAIYLPTTEEKLEKQIELNKSAEEQIKKILEIDRERLDLIDDKIATVKFDYATAIEQVARSCSISSANYKLSSGMTIKTGVGQKTQSARVSLSDIDITTFSKFLSILELRWPALQCTLLSLSRQKGMPDVWKVDLNFNYYY